MYHILYMLWCLKTNYATEMLHKCKNMLQELDIYVSRDLNPQYPNWDKRMRLSFITSK